jgi:kynurenine formamidase
MAKEAWGRWGAADEAGALNYIGADEVRHAAGLVKSGRVFSLAQPISRAMMIPPHRPQPMHFMDRDGGDYAAGGKRPGGFQFAEDTVVLPLHLGTHIDGLCHAWYEDQLYNGFSSNTVRSTTGAQRCGIEKYPPIVTRGILLDFVRLQGSVLPSGTTIGRSLLEAACEQGGVRPRRGDAVLVRTGWLESQTTAEEADFNREPGLDVEAALWLAEAGVALIGADNFAIEVLPFPPGSVFPVHQRLLRDYGVPFMEGLVLRPLAESGASTFLFMAAALPIAGGTGSPLTPLAVL